MVQLRKLYVAHFYDNRKHSFASNKIVAGNYPEAQEIAAEWASDHYNGRVTRIEVEHSKLGEAIAHS